MVNELNFGYNLETHQGLAELPLEHLTSQIEAVTKELNNATPTILNLDNLLSSSLKNLQNCQCGLSAI
jgi:hypothetical protein